MRSSSSNSTRRSMWCWSLCTALLLATVPSPCRASSVLQRRAAVTSSSSLDPRLPPGSARAGDFVCRTTGVCSPCPSNELGSPVCKIFGNRRPLTCVRVSETAKHGAGAGGTGFARNINTEAARPVAADTLPRLDPDPQNLDDEILQDAFRAGADTGSAPAKEARDNSRRWESGSSESSLDSISPRQQQEVRLGGEIFTWEACARVVQKERADFFEFVLCNLFFACASVAVLVYRHRALASRQYGTLAARIGMSVS